MKLLNLLFQTSWIAVILAALAGLLSGFSSAGLIALINLYLKNTQVSQITLVIGFVVLCILLLGTSAASQVLLARVAQQIIFDVQIGLTQSILACPLLQLEKIGSPRLLATLTEDVQVVSTASSSLASLFVNVALLLGCLIYLSWLSLPTFFFLLVFMFLGVVSYQSLLARGRRYLKLARKSQDALFQHFRTVTEGTKELKLNFQRRQAFLKEGLQAAAADFYNYRVAGMATFAIAGSWGIVLFFIPIGLILFGLPLITSTPASVIASYAITIIFMISPMRGVMNTLPELTRATIALETIDALKLSLMSSAVKQSLTVLPDSKQCWNFIKLVGVTHSYQGEREDNNFVLGPIDLTFHPGELVFIIGGNGSGKSTLVKVIAGLYVPEAGVVHIDNQPITDANREWYCQHFSVVFPDFYLFDSLLGLNSPDLDLLDLQAQKYLVQLHLDRKVQVNRGVFSTTALSQGQRKRLALLAAYMEERPFYIFDEWASDQDPMFRDIFYNQLLLELKHQGKTVLVVTHDDRYFHLADRLVKLDYGKVL